MELADEFDRSAGLRPRDFLDIALDSGCSVPSTASVTVMSIHKAKGLEFDSVVLPELHKKFPAKSPLILTNTDSRTFEVTAVARYASKDVAALDDQLHAMYDQYRDNETKEALCLLYVALTRARYNLMVITPTPKRESLTLAALVKDQLCRDSPSVSLSGGGLLLYESGDSRWFESLPESKRPSMETAYELNKPKASGALLEHGRRFVHHSAPSSIQEWGILRADQLLKIKPDGGRLTGLIVHALFQQINWIEDGVPDKTTLIGRVRDIYSDAAVDRIIHEEKNFREMIARPEITRALRRPILEADETSELWVERRFATFVDGKYVTGTFDRVIIISSQGKPKAAHLIDYKTTDLNVSNVAREVDKYRPQMVTYRKALSEILGLDQSKVTAMLLFPREGLSSAV